MAKSNLPHVTEILRGAGLVDVTWFTDQAREIGSALHEATQFLDESDLDWKTVEPVIMSRLHQYQKFLEEMKPKILAVEEDVVNEPYQYCGRLDRRLIINEREGILDIKGPGRFPWQSVQVAMYAACFPFAMVRWTLHLSDDRYQLIEHRGRQDWSVAKAAMVIAAWRREHAEG